MIMVESWLDHEVLPVIPPHILPLYHVIVYILSSITQAVTSVATNIQSSNIQSS